MPLARKDKSWDVALDQGLCKGCYICVEVCPKDVFTILHEPGPGGFRPVQVSSPDKCIGCMLCVIYCPDFALEVNELAGSEV